MSEDATLRKPTTGIPGCCARAASGQAATPPKALMKSRHGELLMLGFEVAQSTVSKYMVRGGTPLSHPGVVSAIFTVGYEKIGGVLVAAGKRENGRDRNNVRPTRMRRRAEHRVQPGWQARGDGV